jgi:hypothetical protein
MSDRKVAEAAQFDSVPTRHSSDDGVENSIYDVLDVSMVEVWVLVSNAFHKLGLDHRHSL